MVKQTNRVTIADVARAAGVSTATVSLVLNMQGDTARISQATRAMVHEAATQLRYTPNYAARALRRHRTGSITLLTARLDNSFYVDIATAVQETAARHDYGLTIVDTTMPGAKLRALEHLRAGGSDGVIIATGHHSTKGADYLALIELVRHGTPAVLALDFSPDPAIPAVRVDNEYGTFLAVHHLVQLGHERIALLTLVGSDPPEVDDARGERYRGYRHALAEAGLPFEPRYVFQGDASTLEAGHILMRMLLASPAPRPTAVSVFNDLMAIGAIRACYEMGVRVPEEMAIIGVGGIATGAYTAPALSTIAHPRAALGIRTAETLFAAIAGTPPAEREQVLPVQLVVRESCGGMPTA